MKVTVGRILKELRIESGLTLREFCIKKELDAVKYSGIERGEIVPNADEANHYLRLVNIQMDGLPKLSHAVITKDVDGFGIRMFVRDMIMPEIIEAMRDRSSSLGDGLKEALGIK